jgi:hypothetical protein
LCYGEYQGLAKSVSAIEVATALHEQYISLESFVPEGLEVAEHELVRKGFDTQGIKESVTDGWKKFSLAKMQYLEIVESKSARCFLSGLSTPSSLQLYASEFDGKSPLTTADCIFLQALESERLRCGTNTRGSEGRSNCGKSFVKKASELGITISPHERRIANILPPLFQSDKTLSVSSDFEQINEDMFSRKENKFMVFNGAAVESWTGTQSITKLRSVPSA